MDKFILLIASETNPKIASPEITYDIVSSEGTHVEKFSYAITKKKIPVYVTGYLTPEFYMAGKTACAGTIHGWGFSVGDEFNLKRKTSERSEVITIKHCVIISVVELTSSINSYSFVG